MAQRVLHVVAGVLFAVVLPRLMGPDTFGRYALITSVALWFALFSGVSSAQTMGRFLPELAGQPGNEKIQKFFGNLLAVRLGTGVFAAAFYFLMTALWFRDLDAVTIAIVAGSVFLRTSAGLVFALFLGLNRAARWGMGDTLRRWASLALLVVGFYFGGLRGACLGLAIAELVVLCVGLRWAWPFFSWSQLRVDARYIAPYLRFGMYFFAANLLLAASQRSGELLVRVVSANYVEVGLFGVAFRIYLTVTQAIWNFSMAFTPLLTMMLAQGREDEIKKWIERLLKCATVGGVFLIYGVLLIGDNLLPLALGPAYPQVARILLPLMVSLLAFAVTGAGRMLALAYDRPRVAVTASAVQLAALWVVGWPLVSWSGSWGASVAMLGASVLCAAFFKWRMRQVLRYPIRNWGLAILIGGLFLPLALMRSSPLVNVALYTAFVIGYSTALLRLRVVTAGELSAMRRAISGGGDLESTPRD
jgi:O-antigen/teichoic acid export membrane protein